MKTKINKWLPLMVILIALYFVYYATVILSNPDELAWWQVARIVWRGGW